MSLRTFALVFVRCALAFALACGCWEFIDREFLFASTGSAFKSGYVRIHAPGPSVRSAEGYSRTWFDENGYRGGAPKVRPPFVVLAIGDSFTDALQVSDDSTYCRQTEKLLGDAGVSSWVVPAGSSGACPADYVGLANWYMSKLAPNRVVVELNEGDFTHDLPSGVGDFSLKGNGKGFDLVSSHPRAASGITRKLLEFSLARTAIMRMTSGGGDESAEGGKTDSAKAIDYSPYVNWAVNNLKRAYGDPILLYIPFIDYFRPGDPPHPVELELAEECAKEQVNLIDMRTAFLKKFFDTRCPSSGFPNTLPGSGHLNEVGHKLVASAISGELLRGISH